MTLPKDAQARKNIPVYSGFVKYFPHAIAAAAELSLIANRQHNPGEELHWVKEKSSDEEDALLRHKLDEAIDPEHRDPDGAHPAVKAFWRAAAHCERLHDAGVDIFAVPVARRTSIDPDEGPIEAIERMLKPHTPTMAEIRDIERGDDAGLTGGTLGGPFEVRFTDENMDGTPLDVQTRGPYDSYEQAESYAARNPENLKGRPSIHTSKLKVRDNA